MIKKVNNIFQKVVIAQVVILVFIFFAKMYFSGISSFGAASLETPESVMITFKEIWLTQEQDNKEVNVFKGNYEVDLAKVSSFQSALDIPCNVNPGKYTAIRIVVSDILKVKGSVLHNSVTYYTKANHTDYATGSAELEEINNDKKIYGSWYIEKVNFLQQLDMGGDITVKAIIDISKTLMYTDSVTNPGAVQERPIGMQFASLPMTVTVGQPGFKEVYDLTSGSETSRLTLLYDGGGNFICGMSRNILDYGAIFLGGFVREYTPQTGGKVKIVAGYTSDTTGISTLTTLPNFIRSSHSDNWSRNIAVPPAGSTSGVYNAVRVE